MLQISHYPQVSWAEKKEINDFILSMYWSQKQLDLDIQWFVTDPCLSSHGATTSAACVQFGMFCCQMDNVKWKEFKEQWQSLDGGIDFQSTVRISNACGKEDLVVVYKNLGNTSTEEWKELFQLIQNCPRKRMKLRNKIFKQLSAKIS